MRGWLLILTFALLAVTTTRVCAEIVVEDTLEWRVADADLIVRCKPVEIADDRSNPNHQRERVTFRISETFKGAPMGELTVSEYPFGKDFLTQWRHEGTERIVFLVRTDRDKPVPIKSGTYAFRLQDGWCFGEHGRGAERDLYAFTSDSRILRGTDAIEAALRQCVASPSKLLEPTEVEGLNNNILGRPSSRNRSVLAEPVRAEVDRLLWSGSAVLLRLPLDERTEQLALGWMSGGPYERERGMWVLRHLKSDRSIAAFRQVLTDVSYSTEGYGGPVTRWKYWSREAAYDVLRAWGVDVERPAINMPDDGYLVLTWKHGLLAGVAVVGLAIVSRAIVRVRRRWVASIIDAACILLLFLAIGVSLLRGLDRTAVHEISTRLHDSAGWAWLDQHGVTLARAQGYAVPDGVRCGSFDTATEPPARWGAGRLGNNAYQEWAGFRYMNGTITEQISTRSYSGPGPAMPYRSVTAPVWAVAVVLGALPALRGLMMLRAVRRRRARVRNGQCVKCGYDLRSGHDRCPECGAAITQSPPRTVVGGAEQVG